MLSAIADQSVFIQVLAALAAAALAVLALYVIGNMLLDYSAHRNSISRALDNDAKLRRQRVLLEEFETADADPLEFALFEVLGCDRTLGEIRAILADKSPPEIEALRRNARIAHALEEVQLRRRPPK